MPVTEDGTNDERIAAATITVGTTSWYRGFAALRWRRLLQSRVESGGAAQWQTADDGLLRAKTLDSLCARAVATRLRPKYAMTLLATIDDGHSGYCEQLHSISQQRSQQYKPSYRRLHQISRGSFQRRAPPRLFEHVYTPLFRYILPSLAKGSLPEG